MPPLDGSEHPEDMILEELLALEHEGWVSLCNGTGGAVYGELMTADSVMVLSHGVVMDRSEVIASLDAAPPWESYEIQDPRLVTADDRTVSLVYTGIASRSAAPEFRALMSSTYTRRDGTWRLMLYQQTSLVERGP